MYVTIKFTPLDWKEGADEPVVKTPWKFYGTRMSIFPYGRNCG